MSCCYSTCLRNFFISLLAICVISFITRVILPSFALGKLETLKKKYNSSGKAWVVITGTTSGIGYAFCHAFVKLGFNILMISRNESKLKETKKEFEKFAGKSKIEYLCLDLSSTIVVDSFEKFVATNEVALLVNNAGYNTEYPKLFVDNSKEEITSMLAVNCASLVLLTRICLVSMVHRRCGGIINISSLFGQLGGPLVSTYSGTKSFIDSFSLSLAGELAGTGVQVFCSLPGFVVTNMSKIRKTSMTVISADQCVQTVLKQFVNGTYIIAAPHWTHSAISWIMITIVPEFIRIRILTWINRKTNRAALRKIDRMAAAK